MKNIILKLAMLVAGTIAACSVSAQPKYDAKWGATPEEQQENIKNFSLFRDAYNNKDYDEALEYLPKILEKIPSASPNTYIYGINIYKDRILKATSLADKNKDVDELMKLYDLRARHFGDDPNRGRAYILGLKADDFAMYKPADRDNLVRYYKEAVDVAGENAEPEFVNRYFSELTSDYMDDMVESDDYLAEYDRLEAIMNLPKNADKEQDKNTFDALFLKSGAADCENIERMFKARLAENPDDVATLEKAAGLLTRGKCKGEFYFSVAEKLYELNPTSNTAMILAAGYEEQKDYQKALEYLNAALSAETDPEAKVNLALRIAGSELNAGNSRSAANFARQAMELSTDNGFAYYILAQAYVGGANQCSDDFSRMSVYWLAHDTLVNAKRLLGSDESKVGDIDSQLARFRANFPTTEEGFWKDIKEGERYTVSCGWISGSTTVRFRK